MTGEPIAPSDHAWALAEAARLRDDRSNSSDKTHWWATTHQRLAAHSPDGVMCASCGEAWPCIPAAGAIMDLRSGGSGY
jgi:hypothetical protein